VPVGRGSEAVPVESLVVGEGFEEGRSVLVHSW
jgi:hypothetical protein